MGKCAQFIGGDTMNKKHEHEYTLGQSGTVAICQCRKFRFVCECCHELPEVCECMGPALNGKIITGVTL